MPKRYSFRADRSISIQGQRIDYVLRISSQRRTIGFKVDTEGLTVTSPPWVSPSDLERAILQQSDWIVHKLQKWAERAPAPTSIQFLDGDLVWWMGQQIPIRWVSSHEALPQPRALAEIKELHTLPIWEECSDRLAAVTAWYVLYALPWFKSRTQIFAEKLGRYPRSIKISQAKGRWGSCNRSGVIRLNWRLMKASPAEIDYVIAHECAHLVHMNHSPDFWNTVNDIHPNWKPISKLLDSRDLHYRSF